MRPKDPLPTMEKSAVIYKINCKNCEGNYVGETAKRLGTRLHEHKLAIKRGEQHSQLWVHMAQQQDHQFDFANTCIVANDATKRGRLLKEAWFSNNNSINRHIDLCPAQQALRKWDSNRYPAYCKRFDQNPRYRKWRTALSHQERSHRTLIDHTPPPDQHRPTRQRNLTPQGASADAWTANPPPRLGEGKENCRTGRLDTSRRYPNESLPPPERGGRDDYGDSSIKTLRRSSNEIPRLETTVESDDKRLTSRGVSLEIWSDYRPPADASPPLIRHRPARGGKSPPLQRTGADTLLESFLPMEKRITCQNEPPPPRIQRNNNEDVWKGLDNRLPEYNSVKRNEEEQRTGGRVHKMTTRSLGKRENSANERSTQIQPDPPQEEWKRPDLNIKQQKEPDVSNIVVENRNRNRNTHTHSTRIKIIPVTKEGENIQCSKDIELQPSGVKHTQIPNQTQRSNKTQKNAEKEHNTRDAFKTPADQRGPVTRSRSRVQTSTKPI